MSLKITPLEIRQKSFEKVLRGYDKDEVTAFLITLSKEWEKTIEENKELKSQVETAQREILKLREAEAALLQSINESEHSGNNLVEQVTQAAEIQFRESQINAEAFIQEARIKARNLMEEAELEAQQLVEVAEHKLKELISDYKDLTQHKSGFTDNLLKLIEELSEKTTALRQLHRDFDPDIFLADLKSKFKVTEEINNPVNEDASSDSALSTTMNPPQQDQAAENKSFFDTIV